MPHGNVFRVSKSSLDIKPPNNPSTNQILLSVHHRTLKECHRELDMLKAYQEDGFNYTEAIARLEYRITQLTLEIHRLLDLILENARTFNKEVREICQAFN